MKAFILDRYGSADRVRAGDMPDPELREDEVLVQVRAAGVNQLDSKIRSGEFKRILRYRLPLILGHDVAGGVVRIGSRVQRFKPGDEVYARPADGRIGAFAEFIAIKEGDVAIKPRALTMEEAASIPLVGLDRLAGTHRTSESAEGTEGSHPRRLWWRRHICDSAGEARRRDRGNDDEHGQRGASQKPRSRHRDRLQEGGLLERPPRLRRRLAEPGQGDVEKSLGVLKPGGQLISISGPPDAAFARSIGASWVVRTIIGVLSYGIRAKAKRHQAHYSFLFMRANGDQLTKITALIDEGIIRPVVDRVFPFASTKEAMAYVEGGRAKGKVVVTVRFALIEKCAFCAS
jgi:NADPH:quinone reductase-like Zn-dependent oxidoreductase